MSKSPCDNAGLMSEESKTDEERFAARVAELMAAHRLKIRPFARLIGVDDKTVRLWLDGSGASARNAGKIADRLGLTVEQFLGRDSLPLPYPIPEPTLEQDVNIGAGDAKAMNHQLMLASLQRMRAALDQAAAAVDEMARAVTAEVNRKSADAPADPSATETPGKASATRRPRRA